MRLLKDLPGPRKSPLFGHLFQIKPTQVHQQFEQWAKEYGPQYVVWFGKLPVLVQSEHKMSSQLLRDRPDGFTRTRRTALTSREMGLTPGLFSAEGDAWRNQRRMVMASFSPTQIRAYFPSMQRVTERLRQRWLKACAQGASTHSKPIELQDDLMRYTVDTITGLAFGSDVNTLEAGENVIQQHMNQILPAIARRSFSPLPYWRFFKLPKDHALDRGVKVVNDAIDQFIAQARERLANDAARRENPPNLLESFIVSAIDEDGKISDEDIKGNVLTMLLAGEDTTANSIAWMLHLLHEHPDCLARLKDELRRVVGNNPAPDIELLANLPYMDACISETMRLKPVAPFIPIQALKDTLVGDVMVPKDALVWNLLRPDAVSTDYFAQGQAFEPQRWLDSVNPPVKNVTMPFGSGPRMCPGRYLALLEMKMCIAMLLTHFDLESVFTKDGQKVRERMSFTMIPEDLFMTLKAKTVTA